MAPCRTLLLLAALAALLGNQPPVLIRGQRVEPPRPLQLDITLLLTILCRLVKEQLQRDIIWMFVSYDICRNRTGSGLHTGTSCVLGGNFIITWVFLITRYLLPIRISQSIVNLDRRLQTVIVTREQSPFIPSQPPLSPSHCSSRNHRDLSLLVSREVSRVTWPQL